MGVDYIAVNLDKREVLNFGPLGFGQKIGATTFGLIPSIPSWLLVNCEGYDTDSAPMLGRWASSTRTGSLLSTPYSSRAKGPDLSQPGPTAQEQEIRVERAEGPIYCGAKE